MLLDSLLATGLTGLFIASIFAIAIYGLLLAIYRLFFSPIAGFPGPRLAAATGWYEFYYDVIQGGTYVHKIVDLHAQYGESVRHNNPSSRNLTTFQAQ